LLLAVPGVAAIGRMELLQPSMALMPTAGKVSVDVSTPKKNSLLVSSSTSFIFST
jgi:hypothetical protein